MVGFLDADETGGGDKAVARPGHVRSHPGTPLGPILAEDVGEFSSPNKMGAKVSGPGNGFHWVSLVCGMVIGCACTIGAMSMSWYLRRQKYREGYFSIQSQA
jgi:hypothetical protein